MSILKLLMALGIILMVTENMCSTMFLQSKFGVHITTVNGVEYDFNGH